MKWRLTLIGIAAGLALAGCGGGDPTTSAVRVVGDSLSDSGTFGLKFTVQNTPAFQIWTDVVTQGVDAPALCPRYALPVGVISSVPVLNPAATDCTSYGVGGGRINPSGSAADSTPVSIVQQLQDAGSRAYARDELLLANGGGNDIADLVGAYLALSSDGGTAYTTLLSELLTAQQVSDAVAGGADGLAAAGGTYMVALANRFADALTTHALNRGAQRVVVQTAPDVTRTPRFTAVLAGVALAAGGGTTGEAVANQVRTLANAWVTAFNNQLRARLNGVSGVAIVDFYTELNGWLDNPSAFGLTNTTTPACPITGTDPQGLPSYSIATCTADLLSANPPTGVTDPAWWETYVFSDNFHGTPRTNELMGELTLRVIRDRGWD
ncbi:MAG: phospholipase [Burkholderiales bacterium]|nr:MAG: phospholipase [Burkholderiales bacterium]